MKMQLPQHGLSFHDGDDGHVKGNIFQLEGRSYHWLTDDLVVSNDASSVRKSQRPLTAIHTMLKA